MNVIIENLNSKIIDEINIEDAKRLTGIYDVNQIFSEVSSIDINKAIVDITAINNFLDINNIKSLASFIAKDNLILVINEENVNSNYLKQIIELGIYNIAYNSKHIVELCTEANDFDDVKVLLQGKSKNKIIGIKNITKNAGATTLCYMLKKHLEKRLKVTAIEVNKLDFNYFKDKSLVTILEQDLEYSLNKYYDSDIILVDVNDSKKALENCDEVLYLIEPSMLKINQLMIVDPTVFQKLSASKIILNKSTLSKEEEKNFEFEAHMKAFYILPSLNEREKNNQYIENLISKLGL